MPQIFRNLFSAPRQQRRSLRDRFRPLMEQLEHRLAMSIATGAHPTPEGTIYVNQFGDAYVYSSIDSFGDTDTYATFFKTVPPGGTVSYTTRVDVDNNLNPVLDLEMGYWNDTNNPNARQSYNDDYAGGRNPLISANPGEFNDVAVQIGEFADNDADDYTLEVNGPDQGPITSVSLGELVLGSISNKNDFKFYQFTAPTTDTYHFTAGFMGAPFEATAKLFTTGGTPIIKDPQSGNLVAGTFLTVETNTGGITEAVTRTYPINANQTGVLRVDGLGSQTGSFWSSIERAAVAAADTPGVFDQSTGNWYLRTSNSGGAPTFPVFNFGGAGWKPVVGDWNGDTVATAGVVDPSMTWYLRHSNSSGAPNVTPFQYGAPGWVPLAGDWNGDGTATVGVFDPNTATWYLRNSNSAGGTSYTPFQYGAPGWIPVVGDWDGNGTTTIGVVDPNTMTWYLKNTIGAGSPMTPFQYGAPGWIPVVGDWNGGGDTTIGVVDPNSETWYLRNSNSSGGPTAGQFQYGGAGWRPLGGNFNGGGGAALQAAAPGSELDIEALSQADLDSTVTAVLARLEGQGLDPRAWQRLVATQFVVADLSGLNLGLAYAGSNTVVIDADAAGHGWYVDATPLQDGDAFSGMDLLSAVLHEMGHITGLQHDDDGGVMNAFLEAGVRHADLDAFFAHPAH